MAKVFILEVEYIPYDSCPPDVAMVFTTLRLAKAYAQKCVELDGSGKPLEWSHDNHAGDPLRTWDASDKNRGVRAEYFIHDQELEL
jgi:hypothetical protein